MDSEPFPCLRGTHVLLVEGDEDTRVLFGVVLEEAGARVSAASSARDGLLRFLEEPPDIIVSDIAMPGEDGYWLLEQIGRRSEGDRDRYPRWRSRGKVIVTIASVCCRPASSSTR